MRKRIALMLIAALCLLLSMNALADDISGRGGMVAQGDGLAAYLDGDGNLLIPGNEQRVNLKHADSIISIDSYRLIYLSRSAAENEPEKTALVCMDLSTFEETILHENVHAACAVGSGNVYFIPAEERTQLCLMNFESGQISNVYTSVEALDSLYESAEGLVVTLVENAGAVIYVEATDSFEPFGTDIPVKSIMAEDDQVYITQAGTLYLRRPDSLAADAIDMNVYDFALLDGKIYYLANTGSVLRIKVYDPELLEQKVLVTPEAALEPQLTASQNQLFVLGSDDQIYRVNPEDGVLEAFAAVQLPELEEGVEVISYSIHAMSGRLNVYAHLSKTEAKPEFTFMEFASDVAGKSSHEPMLLYSIVLDGEAVAWDLLQPAVQYAPLSRGSRGEAVSAIQKPLLDRGYYDYYIDGIFGYRTDNAVRLLQEDLGLNSDGIADEHLQRIILSGSFPDYDPYLQQNRGNRGLRVQQMQQRLRALGYLADGADGIFGGRTQAAVQLFQRENNLSISESATRDTLMKLFNPSALKCSSYIDLRSGDSGYRVRDLNKRLKELFYLNGSVNDTYTSETTEAVKRFQTQVGMTADGNASAIFQQRLFAPGAPECSGYSELQRGDENTRVRRLQRRLKELNYFSGSITGYFGKNTQAAVKLFQQTVGMRPTGVATVKMQKLLFSPEAPVYIKPTILGQPVISIDCFDKRDGGVYYLSDASSETGYVTFTWAAEGYVDSYSAILTDDQGTVLLDQNTDMTMTTVPISSLALNRVYTLKIVAYPEDGNENHVTYSTLSFCRTEVPEESVEIGTITDVFTSIETVSRVENDIHYVKPGTVTFRWYAEGDISSYHIEIRDARSNVLLSADTVEEQASVTTKQMLDGEIYTLCVYAIPVNGTLEHAVLKTQSFSLETEIEEIPSVAAPTVSIEGADADANGVYVPTGDQIILRWNVVENAAQYHIEVRDAAGEFVAGDTTLYTDYTLETAILAAGSSYEIRVTAIAEGGSIEEASTAVVVIAVPEEEIVIELGAPAVSIADAQLSEAGIAYIRADAAMTLEWTAVEGASAYNISICDSDGMILISDTTSGLSFEFDPIALEQGAEYSASVTAIPQEGINATAATTSLIFVVNAPESNEQEPNEEAPSVPAENSDPEIEVDSTEEQTEVENALTNEGEEQTEVEDDEPAVAELSGLVIGIEPIVETIDAINYVQNGMITFSWCVDGSVSGYRLELKMENEFINALDTVENFISIDTEAMMPETVYTFRVTAIPENGTLEDGLSGEVLFALDEEAVVSDEIISEEAEENEYDAEEEVISETEEEPVVEETPVEPTDDSDSEPVVESVPESSAESMIDVLDPEIWLLPLDPFAEEFSAEDIARITAVQAKLVELLWLEPETFEEGILDEATLMAVYNFQLDYNLVYGEVLVPLSEEMPMIDPATLTALMVQPMG